MTDGTDAPHLLGAEQEWNGEPRQLSHLLTLVTGRLSSRRHGGTKAKRWIFRENYWAPSKVTAQTVGVSSAKDLPSCVMKLSEQEIGRAEAPMVIAALAAWTPVARGSGPLHPGDIGWFLRLEEDLVRPALRLWSDTSGPVAVSLLDGPVLPKPRRAAR